jgi:hypothetical protein
MLVLLRGNRNTLCLRKVRVKKSLFLFRRKNMKKWIKITSLALALGAFGYGSGLTAGENKPSCKYSQKDKAACDWSKCGKADCEKHAANWDDISVSDFYEV